MEKKLKRDAEHIVTAGVDSEAMYKRVCNYLKELLHIRPIYRALKIDLENIATGIAKRCDICSKEDCNICFYGKGDEEGPIMWKWVGVAGREGTADDANN